MRVLITGATGFVGSHFIARYHGDFEITALVRSSSDTAAIAGLCEIFRYGEFSDFRQLFSPNAPRFDCILHLATNYAPAHEFEQIPAVVADNITFGAMLLEASHAQPAGAFVNAMTQLELAHQLAPHNIYAATKQSFFDLIKYYAQILPTTFTHLLMFDTYGAHSRRTRLIDLFARAARSGERLDLSDGRQLIDLSHIDDITRAISLLLNSLQTAPQAASGKIYALESTRYTLRELAEIFSRATGRPLHINWGAQKYWHKEIPEPISHKTCELVEPLPDYAPQISLESGFKRVFELLSFE